MSVDGIGHLLSELPKIAFTAFPVRILGEGARDAFADDFGTGDSFIGEFAKEEVGQVIEAPSTLLLLSLFVLLDRLQQFVERFRGRVLSSLEAFLNRAGAISQGVRGRSKPAT